MKLCRQWLASALVVSACLLWSASAQAFLNKFEQDGILFIEAVGFLPDPEFGDNDNLRDEQGRIPSEFQDAFEDRELLDIRSSFQNTLFGLQDECFESYLPPTLSFEIAGNVLWGSDNDSEFGDVDRVQIGGRAASDFGFLRDEVIEFDISTDNGTRTITIPCSDVEPQWNEYDEPDSGRIFILSGLTVEAGVAGTEVNVSDGFELFLFTGANFTVRGTESEPVVFRGNQWNGIELGAGVNADLEYCEFRQASNRGALRVLGGATLTARHCSFSNNEGGQGGAIQALGDSVIRIEDSEFSGNDASRGGGIFLRNTAPGARLTNVVFDGNEALRGGAIYLEDVTDARLQNITVTDGEAGRGGGVMIDGGSAHLWNPVIVGNTGRRSGGGLRISGSANVRVDNPTIAFNEATTGGGIALVDDGGDFNQLDLRNAIVFGNVVRDTDDASGPQIDHSGPGMVQLRRVMIEGGGSGGFNGPAPVTSDIVAGDPAFRRAPDEAGVEGGSPQADWRLAAESNAINRGDDNLFDASGFAAIDRDGNGRIFGQEEPRIDLGAFEFPNNAPTLLTTDDINISLAEGDSPAAFQFCSQFTDADIQPAFPNTVQVPWLTRAPEEGFGEILQDEGGPGDPISADSRIENASGRVFYDPERRSSSYEVTVECRVRDLLKDVEGEVDEELSLLSEESQTVRIQVSARNDPPSIDGAIDRDGESGRLYESEFRVSDSDADHRARDLDIRIVSGPAWLEIERISDEEAVLRGRPPEPGEYDVEVEVVDPAGGTTRQTQTIIVEMPADELEVTAGNDLSAEPGEQVRLSAEGPDRASLTYEWRILDRNDEEVASELNRDFTWTAQAGSFTAVVELSDGVDVLTDDSLNITVEEGFSGSVEGGEERSPPDEEQEQALDGMAEDGDPENVEEWEARPDDDKAAALSNLAGTELDEEQQDAVLGQSEQITDRALASADPIDEGLAAELTGTYGKLAELELTAERQEQVLEGAQRLRDRAEADGSANASVRAGLARAGGGLLQQDDLSPERREAILAGLDDDLSGLDQQLATEELDAEAVGRVARAYESVPGDELTPAQREARDAGMETLLDQSAEMTDRALESDEPIDEATATELAQTLDGLAGLELADERQEQVLGDMQRMRERAESDGSDGTDVRAGLARAGGRMIAQDDLPAERREAIIAGLGDDLSELNEQLAAEDAPPLDVEAAARVARTYGSIPGDELGADERDAMIAGMEALRERAQEDGAGSQAQTAEMVRAAGGMLRAGEDLSSEQRDRLLSALSTDLAAAREQGFALNDRTTNRALAALKNSVAGEQLDQERVDDLIGGVSDAIAGNGAPSDTQLSKAATTVNTMLSQREGRGLTADQRVRIKDVGRELASVAVANGQPINVTGGRFFNVAGRQVPPDADDPVLVGKARGPGQASSRGPTLSVPPAAIAELRARNAVAEGEAIGIAIIATLRDEESAYVVQLRALDGNGEPLSDVSLEQPVRLTIPVTQERRKQPISVDPDPVTMSNIEARDRGVDVDVDRFATFSLTTGVNPDNERSDSEKTECFLDSLF